jgi:lipopolysaccharide export system protein LptA
MIAGLYRSGVFALALTGVAVAALWSAEAQTPAPATPPATPPAAGAPAAPGPAAPANAPAAPAGTPGAATPAAAAPAKPPLQVSADNGVEWQKDTQLYIARGNAVATRGDLRVRGDVLTAHYRATTGNKTEIFRVDAVGGVVFTQNGGTATGGQAIYDVDTKALRMTGGNLTYTNNDSRITARDSLEYYDDKKQAVARGNAVAVRGDDTVHADVLTGYFTTGDGTPNSDGKRHLSRIDAAGNVVVNSQQNVAYAENATYNTDTKIAILTGKVRIVRGADQLLGERAEVNMNTGAYRMLPGTPGSRVTGVLQPDQKLDDTPGQTPATKPAAGKKPAKKPVVPPGNQPTSQPANQPAKP